MLHSLVHTVLVMSVMSSSVTPAAGRAPHAEVGDNLVLLQSQTAEAEAVDLLQTADRPKRGKERKKHQHHRHHKRKSPQAMMQKKADEQVAAQKKAGEDIFARSEEDAAAKKKAEEEEARKAEEAKMRMVDGLEEAKKAEDARVAEEKSNQKYDGAHDAALAAARAKMAAETEEQRLKVCGGRSWLLDRFGISPCVRAWAADPSISSGANYVATIENCNDDAATNRGCRASDLDIWVGAYGPENLAQLAEPSSDKCEWTVKFNFSMPGEYTMWSRLLQWGANLDFDEAKCQAQPGKVWQGGEVLVSVKTDRLYSPEHDCCEACTRNPRCTHYSTQNQMHSGNDVLIHRGDFQYKCLLLANANGTTDDDKFVSGVARGEPTMHFLGGWPNWWEHDAKLDDCDTQKMREEQFLAVSSVKLNVNLEQDQAVRFYDTSMLAGETAAEGSRCPMKDVVRLPHKGRWLDVTQKIDAATAMVEVESDITPYPELMKEQCGPVNMDNYATPLHFLGPVVGPVPQGVKQPVYYWQPYDCDYVHFTRQELRKHMGERNLKNFFFQGDSLMTSWGTGLFTQFYEILIGFNHSKSSPPYWNEAETTFSIDFEPGHFEKRAKEGLDVFVTNFEIVHKVHMQNQNAAKDLLRQDLKELDKVFAKAPDGKQPRKFYLAPPPFIAERESHITARRAISTGNWLREILAPLGWVELDYSDMAMTRGFDSTCMQDGMHPAHNVRVMMSQVLANQLAFAV